MIKKYAPRKQIFDINNNLYIFNEAEYKIITMEFNRTEKHYGKYDPFGNDEIYYKKNRNIHPQKLVRLNKFKKNLEIRIKVIEEKFPITFMIENVFEMDRLCYYYSTCIRRIDKLINPNFYEDYFYFYN